MLKKALCQENAEKTLVRNAPYNGMGYCSCDTTIHFIPLKECYGTNRQVES